MRTGADPSRGRPVRPLATLAPMGQKYRMRTPSTGREILLEAEPGSTYVDRETGEPLEVVGKVLPLAPSQSQLPWAVENLRFCNWCDQLAQKDLNDCPELRPPHGRAPALTLPRACAGSVPSSCCRFSASRSSRAGCGGGRLRRPGGPGPAGDARPCRTRRAPPTSPPSATPTADPGDADGHPHARSRQHGLDRHHRHHRHEHGRRGHADSGAGHAGHPDHRPEACRRGSPPREVRAVLPGERRRLLRSVLRRLRRRDQRRGVGQARGPVEAAVLREVAQVELRRLRCRAPGSCRARGSRATTCRCPCRAPAPAPSSARSARSGSPCGR